MTMHRVRSEIVHGTYNTLLNAGRSKFHLPEGKDSHDTFSSHRTRRNEGAQPKAAEIAGAAFEKSPSVDPSRIETRHSQVLGQQENKGSSWRLQMGKEAMDEGKLSSIAYEGNIVDLLQYALDNKNIELPLTRHVPRSIRRRYCLRVFV